jgi:hypothetical protein
MTTRDDIIRMAREAGWKDLPTARLAFAGFNLERFARAAYEAGAAAEREAISDEYSSRLQNDLEHGVKWLNEAASEEFTKKHPELSAFLKWLDARSLR